jgi:ribosomal subunit interface protein
MKIDIRGYRIAIPDELQMHTERRLHFALNRFGGRILNVTVQLAEVNNSRGGIDKQCRMTVAILGSGHIRAEVLDSDFASAIDRAADHLQRTVTRELERQQGFSFLRPIPVRLPAAAVFQRQSRLRDEKQLSR